MDILPIATELLSKALGGSAEQSTVSNALKGLLGNTSGELDVAGLVSKFATQGSMQDMLSSWLGDGENASVNEQQITDVIGQDKISAFASQLGLGESQASSTLANILPQLIDKSSTGGSLLEQAGGLGGLADMAKKFF